MSSSFGGSFSSRRDWTGKASFFSPRALSTPLIPSGMQTSWDMTSQKYGSLQGPASISSSSSLKHDADEGLNHFGVTSHVPRSAFFASTFEASPKEEIKSNELLEQQLLQIQQTSDEYKEEADKLKFHVDALKTELQALNNQHRASVQFSFDNLKLERESANAQLLKSQLQSENLRKNLAALQIKVVQSFMEKWSLFHKKNVIYRIMKCWRTLSM
jgi:hypothetical protein